jgi:hypothetical protein
MSVDTKQKNRQGALSRWFFYILLQLRRLSYLFVAIVLGALAFFAFRYWQSLDREPIDLYSSVSDSNYSINVFYPDRVALNGKGSISVEVEAAQPPEEDQTIEVSFNAVADHYAYFEPSSINLMIPAGETSASSPIEVGYRNAADPKPSFAFQALIISPFGETDSPLEITSSIQVDAISQPALRTFTVVASVAGGIVSFILSIMQLYELLRPAIRTQKHTK